MTKNDIKKYMFVKSGTFHKRMDETMTRIEAIEQNIAESKSQIKALENKNITNCAPTQNPNNSIDLEREAYKIMAEINNRERMRIVYARDSWYHRAATVEDNRPLSPEELKEINDFWAPYTFAYKNNPETQRVLSRISGRFDPTYVGFGLMRYELRRWYGHPSYQFIYNKSYLDVLFPDVKQPKAIVHFVYGYFYDTKHERIDLDQAVHLTKAFLQSGKNKEIIAKPSDTTGMGQAISFIDNSWSLDAIKKLFLGYKTDFICQEVIKNHSSWAAPHPESLQTLRIVTLIYKNEVKLVGAVYRMGVNARVDNVAQGGVACAVDTNGICGQFACDEYGKRFYKHPNGFEFAGHKLYNYKKVEETVMHMHWLIPQQKYISWDMTVDENGDVVFIEINSPGGSEVLQVVGIPSLINKEIAKWVLDDCMKNRFFLDRANADWDFKEFHNSISLVRYAGKANVVKVPLFINGKPVRKIWKDAFVSSHISEIHMPKNLSNDQKTYEKCAKDCKVILE